MSLATAQQHSQLDPHSALDKFFSAPLGESDPEIAAVLANELARQQDEIELIASENYVSRAVLEAAGSRPHQQICGRLSRQALLRRLPRRRCRRGTGHRAREALFACEFANVQPHSGSQANQGVFLAVLKPGDTILGMGIDMGGHLTHGAAPNMSGKWFNAIQYGVRRDTGIIDYEQVEQLAKEHKPRLIIAGGSAYRAHHRFQALPRDRR